MPAAPPSKRRSAEDRRAEVEQIALRHFAVGGYAGTSTEAIAVEAGISQPYLFRLYKTKKQLFLAAVAVNHALIEEAFRAAAAAAPEGEKLSAMGRAYKGLIEDRTLLLAQIQGFAASGDPELRDACRAAWAHLAGVAREVSGASDDELWRFMAVGMALNVIAALDLGSLAGEPGAEAGFERLLDALYADRPEDGAPA